MYIIGYMFTTVEQPFNCCAVYIIVDYALNCQHFFKNTVLNINVYAALTFVVVALFIFFIREKHSRKVYALCTVPLWIYQSISDFGFINGNFDGIGSYFAQLNDGSVFLSLAIIAAAPHIAMAVNGPTKPENQ